MINLANVVNEIDNNNKFVILSHKKPDGDAIGSALAMCHLLRKLGKESYIVQHDDFPENIEFLKNDMFVEKVNYNPDVVICVDSADLSRVEDRMIYDAITVNIDHHISNTNFADINCVDAKASAAGEIIYNLCKYYNVFSDDIYTAIYTAICTDTNRLYYSNTTHNTVKIVSEIYENKNDVYDINKAIYGSKDLSKIKLDARAVEMAEFYYDNKVAITVINKETQELFGSTDTDGIVELLRDIKGVEVSILLYEYNDGLKCSLRSKSYFDVSKIALKFGGGGHKNAAGASLESNSIDKSKKQVLEAILECME